MGNVIYRRTSAVSATHASFLRAKHLVFSTKDRRKLLPKELQPKLWAYIAGVCKNHRIEVEAIDGTEDYIHLLIRIPATVNLSEAVLLIESNSSKWLK